MWGDGLGLVRQQRSVTEDDIDTITEQMIDNADREKSGAAATPLGSVVRNELVLDFFEQRELPVVPRPKTRVVLPGVQTSYDEDDWYRMIMTQRGFIAVKPTPIEELASPVYGQPHAPDVLDSLLASSEEAREWDAFTAAREAVRPTRRMLQSWVKTTRD